MRKALAFAALALMAAPMAPASGYDGATARLWCEADSEQLKVACTGLTEGLAISAYWFTLVEGSPYYGTVCVPPDLPMQELGDVVRRRLLYPTLDLEQVSPAIALEALQLKFPCTDAK